MKSKTSQTTVIGVFGDRARAEEAVHALRDAGFKDTHISVVTRGHEGESEGNYAGTGATTGAVAGAGVAALVSLGMTFGVIPVIGPILAVGPLAAALISAAGGAVAGGLAGALIGMGIPEDEAEYYQNEVTAGNTLVTVQATTAKKRDEAWTILQRFGAYNRETAAIATTTTTTTASSAPAARTTTEGEQTVQVHEEELHARKTPVKTGEVRVRKEVITEQQNLTVPVEREEVVIERRPASGRASASDLRAGEEIRIPVREEQVRVEKEPVVKEEVRVGKRKVRDTKQVSGTVRKERVKVEREGTAPVRGSTTRRRTT